MVLGRGERFRGRRFGYGSAILVQIFSVKSIGHLPLSCGSLHASSEFRVKEVSELLLGDETFLMEYL